jgi:hypothetical protein
VTPRWDVEIVLDQHDGLGVREVAIGQIFQDVSVVDGGVAVRLEVAPAFERREQHEQVGGAVALVLVVDAGFPRPLWRSRLAFVPMMSGSRLNKPFLGE